MKADRNGFFYVINRESGKADLAEPFVPTNWAKGVDMQTGMPIEDPTKRPQLGKWARNVCPNLIGGKNWEPMSYSQQTGLVYIPTFNMCMDIANKRKSTRPASSISPPSSTSIWRAASAATCPSSSRGIRSRRRRYGASRKTCRSWAGR
jgi:glucose dehydrogenase